TRCGDRTRSADARCVRPAAQTHWRRARAMAGGGRCRRDRRGALRPPAPVRGRRLGRADGLPAARPAGTGAEAEPGGDGCLAVHTRAEGARRLVHVGPTRLAGAAWRRPDRTGSRRLPPPGSPTGLIVVPLKADNRRRLPAMTVWAAGGGQAIVQSDGTALQSS